MKLQSGIQGQEEKELSPLWILRHQMLGGRKRKQTENQKPHKKPNQTQKPHQNQMQNYNTPPCRTSKSENKNQSTPQQCPKPAHDLCLRSFVHVADHDCSQTSGWIRLGFCTSNRSTPAFPRADQAIKPRGLNPSYRLISSMHTLRNKGQLLWHVFKIMSSVRACMPAVEWENSTLIQSKTCSRLKHRGLFLRLPLSKANRSIPYFPLYI